MAFMAANIKIAGSQRKPHNSPVGAITRRRLIPERRRLRIRAMAKLHSTIKIKTLSQNCILPGVSAPVTAVP